jgi:hypothetical protein
MAEEALFFAREICKTGYLLSVSAKIYRKNGMEK